MTKKAFNIILASTVIVVLLLVTFCILNGRVLVGQTSAQSANLTEDQLAALKRKAIDQGDRESAARIYWYYRFTKKDFVEAKKWEYATEPFDEKNSTNSGL